MTKSGGSTCTPWLLCSMFLNISFLTNLYLNGQGTLSWTKKAAEEAEAVAVISCSGHGRAYLDGLLDDGQLQPSCECNNCYAGLDCSVFTPGCPADADAGDPLFLEPFWLNHPASSALVVSGWHRMSYSYNDRTTLSAELERKIRKLHEIFGNADTAGRYIVFGVGSTQLLNAAVHALSPDNSSTLAAVVASIPYYNVYETQTKFFQSMQFNFQGDATLWKNNTDSDTTIIEFVTSPNNPDGQAMKPVLQSRNVKSIHDRAYYWPHFTAIPAPANEDLMLFTMSKLTGHAGSRFGWALVKDEGVYQRMSQYVKLNTIGVSKETQLRALKLIKVVLEGNGREIMEFGYNTMKYRWERIKSIFSVSKRYSIQKIPPQYCNYYNLLREASPAYAWVKCEVEEDRNCYEVLKAANIIGREGKVFGSEDRYVRLSLVKSQDDFDLLIHYLNILVMKEAGAKVI